MPRNHFMFPPEMGVKIIRPNFMPDGVTRDGTYTIVFERNGKTREKTFMMAKPGKDFESFELKAKSHIRSLKD